MWVLMGFKRLSVDIRVGYGWFNKYIPFSQQNFMHLSACVKSSCLIRSKDELGCMDTTTHMQHYMQQLIEI